MRKYGWKIIVLVVLAAIVFVWLIKAPIMSAYLTKRMRVPVSIGEIGIWPSETTIRHFVISNPSGFKHKAAFKAAHADINYQFHRLFGSTAEIDQILVNDVVLNIECSNPLCTSNNWTAIGQRIPKEESKKQKGVLIHHLVLTNVRVEIRGFGLLAPPTVKTIDRMEFDEIDSRSGFPTKQLINQIFDRAGLLKYIQDAFNVPQNAIDKFLKPFKSFGTQNEKISDF